MGRYPKSCFVSSHNESLVHKYFAANLHFSKTSKKTILSTMRVLDNFLKGKPLKEVTGVDISQWLKTYKSATTMDAYLGKVKMVLNWLYDEELPRDIAKLSVKKLKQKERRLLPEDLLTPDEVKALMKYMKGQKNPEAEALLAVNYATGARIGELFSMRVKDVLELHGDIAIRVNGKTGEHYYYVEPFAIPYLQAWLQIRSRANPEDPLWLMAYSTYAELLNDAAKAAGITKRVYPHLFRHMRNTRLVRKVGKDRAKRIMGYKPSSHEIDRYTHLTEEDTHDAFLESIGRKPRTQATVAEVETTPTTTCPRCNLEVLADSSYCPQCGLALYADADEVVEQLQTEEVKTLKEQVERLEGLIKQQMRAHIKLRKELHDKAVE